MSTSPVDLTEPLPGVAAIELWRPLDQCEPFWWVAVRPTRDTDDAYVIGKVWGSGVTWLARLTGAQAGRVHTGQEAATRALVARWAAGEGIHPLDPDQAQAGL